MPRPYSIGKTTRRDWRQGHQGRSTALSTQHHGTVPGGFGGANPRKWPALPTDIVDQRGDDRSFHHGNIRLCAVVIGGQIAGRRQRIIRLQTEIVE